MIQMWSWASAETPMAMLTKHVYEPPPPPRVLNPDLSPLLETVLLRALEKKGAIEISSGVIER